MRYRRGVSGSGELLRRDWLGVTVPRVTPKVLVYVRCTVGRGRKGPSLLLRHFPGKRRDDSGGSCSEETDVDEGTSHFGDYFRLGVRSPGGEVGRHSTVVITTGVRWGKRGRGIVRVLGPSPGTLGSWSVSRGLSFYWNFNVSTLGFISVRFTPMGFPHHPSPVEM